MRLNETANISFEIDSDILEESFETLSKKVYLDLSFQVKLIEIEKSNENALNQTFLFDLSKLDLYNISLKHKNDANILYKNKLIRTSFQRYRKAIQFLIIAQQISSDEKTNYLRFKTLNEETYSSKSSDQELDNKISELKSQIYSNIAACQLKSGNFDGVVKNCTNCLEVGDKNNSKALFRRAQAYINLQEFDKAILDLKLAIFTDGSNQELRKSLENAYHLKKKYCNNLSANLKKLF